MPLIITKRDGSKVPFEEKRLRTSLMRAGASDDSIEKVLEEIESSLHNEETTDHIYRKAFTILGKLEKKTAMRYSLRTSIFSFGPTGFPFEKFVGRIFAKNGYGVSFNRDVKGKCSSHEVDVLAQGNTNIAIEVKFHSRIGLRVDLKTVLYVHARFQDLTQRRRGLFPLVPIGERKGLPIHRGLLATNAKFTSRAIQYAECAGVDILGWGYPRNNGLEKLIETSNTHPVTCLPSLRSKAAKRLFENDIIICRDLMTCPKDKLMKIAGDGEIVDSLYEEAGLICT